MQSRISLLTFKNNEIEIKLEELGVKQVALADKLEALKSTSAELVLELAATHAKIKGLKLKKAELEENAWGLLKDATAQFHNMIAIQQDPGLGKAQKAILVKTVEILKTVIKAKDALTNAFICETFAASSGQSSQSSQLLLLSLIGLSLLQW